MPKKTKTSMRLHIEECVRELEKLSEDNMSEVRVALKQLKFIAAHEMCHSLFKLDPSMVVDLKDVDLVGITAGMVRNISWWHVLQTYGERCEEVMHGCPTCDAWAAFDKFFGEEH